MPGISSVSSARGVGWGWKPVSVKAWPAGRGGDGQGAAGLPALMRDAADMPELQDDAAAGLVDSVGDALPALNLGLVMDAGGEGVALGLGRDLGRLRDDQAG